MTLSKKASSKTTRIKNIAQRKPADPAASDSSALPSSHGISPNEVTPKDITPDHAAWQDLKTRNVASGDKVQREEALLDEAIEQTFPASDPIAELPSSPESEKTAQCQDEDEAALDEAIEETFPASDPIAVTPRDKLEVRPRV